MIFPSRINFQSKRFASYRKNRRFPFTVYSRLVVGIAALVGIVLSFVILLFMCCALTEWDSTLYRLPWQVLRRVFYVHLKGGNRDTKSRCNESKAEEAKRREFSGQFKVKPSGRVANAGPKTSRRTA